LLVSIEEPTFSTTIEDGAFEVREYPALLAAEVTVTGDRDTAAKDGFRQLAGYIFGANTTKESIAMTAPVVQTRAADEAPKSTGVVQDDAWTMRFMMPRAYSLETLPTPNNPSIRLKSLPPARFAVAKFSGPARAPEIAKRLTELRAFAAVHRLHADGPSSLARYDSPATLWFMRRNEVLIPLQADAVH
jgi:hypothetical protein